MLVDDNLESLDSISEALELNNYPNQKFSNPYNALQELIKQQYEIVISDYRMPEMNGIEFFKRVRLLNQNAQLILISGFAELNYNILPEMGISCFFTKPLDIVAVMEKLDQIQSRIT